MTPTTIEQLEAARAALSHDPARPLPFRIVRDRLLPILGEYTPTEETLRLLHSGATKRPDPVILAGLAHVYGLQLEELSPAAHAVLRLVTRKQAPVRSRCVAEDVQPTLPGFDGGVWVAATPIGVPANFRSVFSSAAPPSLREMEEAA